MTDYKKDFLDFMKRKKTDHFLDTVEEIQNLKLMEERNAEEYCRVVDKKFLNEMEDVVRTINNTLANMKANFWEGATAKEKNSIHFTISLKAIEEKLTKTYMILEVSSNLITIRSSDDVFEQLNDLGDMDASNAVSFPQKRGKILLEDDDIKEARDQFVRGAYELAKQFH